MKAKLISQRVPDSVLDFGRGGGRLMRRLIIEELGRLCINVVDKQVYAFTGFNLDQEDYALLGTVDVPQEIVDMAVSIAQLDFELKIARAKLYIEVKTNSILNKKLIVDLEF